MSHLNLILISILLIFNRNLVDSACAVGTVDNGSGGCDQCGVTTVSPNVRSFSGNETFIDQKIAGGTVAIANSWPAQALIYLKGTGGSFLCGGTLIKRNLILTAASCLASSTNPADYQVYLGAQSQTNLNSANVVQASVSSISMHPSFSCSSIKNDIAVLTLTTYVTLNNNIQIACLPLTASTTYPTAGVNSWAVGWGSTYPGGSSSNNLMNVKLTVYNGATSCRSYTSSDWTIQVCAGNINGGQDSCQGDYGGPLYVQDTIAGTTRYVLAGVTSNGYKCAQSGFPGIYVRVSAFLTWINSGGGTGKIISCDSLMNQANYLCILANLVFILLQTKYIVSS